MNEQEKSFLKKLHEKGKLETTNIITSGTNGKEHYLKQMSVADLKKLLYSGIDYFEGIDFVCDDQSSFMKIKVLQPLSFNCCRFSGKSFNFWFENKTGVLLRECIINSHIIFTGSLAIELSANALAEFGQYSFIGKMENVSIVSLGANVKPLDLSFYGTNIERMYIKHHDLKLSFLGSKIKKMILRNCNICFATSNSDNRLDNLDIDVNTLRSSLKSSYTNSIDNAEQKYIYAGWEHLIRALYKDIVRGTEVLRLIQGIYGYRAIKIFSTGALRKVINLIRFKFLKNFSSISRVLIFNIVLIIMFSLVYCILGTGLIDKAKSVGDLFYFSAITYTTTGYGDLKPLGIARFFAVLESFIGVVMVIVTGFVFHKWFSNGDLFDDIS